MFVRSERDPNERELPVLERCVAQLAPRADEGTWKRAKRSYDIFGGGARGWIAALRQLLPARRLRELGTRQDERRYENAKRWLMAPRVDVRHVESSRVAFVPLEGDDSLLVFDIGDGRLLSISDDRLPSDDGRWPNTVFEVWRPARAGFSAGGLFCYGTELPFARRYDPEEVWEFERSANLGFYHDEAKEGIFPGVFEDALEAYARYVATGPPRRSW